ncbi:MAG: pitrilysin family protein [Thermodesulfovibrionales bacterium]|nr:pitrilysin family protein [Thermodesulfovibrionales bacterium]
MYKKAFLDNGIPVVMEKLKAVHSVSLGIWVKVGSRNELPEKNGISHFIEHMFFKGTARRSAKDLAISIDSIGGDLNAFTSKEGTTFYVKVLDEYLDKGVELLSDIFLHSTFPEDEIEKEKGVIKEEIKMVEDTPDDYAHELFNKAVWGSNGLGQPILGKRETIKTFSKEDLLNYIKKYYGTKDTVISCAGNFEPEDLMALLNRHLGSLRRGSEPKRGNAAEFRPAVDIRAKHYSEAHICIGVKGIHQASPMRYALSALDTILGASVSSRLFQEIREKRGLAYSIHSFAASYADTGFWAVYAGTGRKKVGEVIELIVKELRGLPDSITASELERAKMQIKGSLILSLESASGRMQSIARQEIYYGRYHSPEEIMKEIESLSLPKVKEFSEQLLKNSPIALTVVGPVDKGRVLASLPPL